MHLLGSDPDAAAHEPPGEYVVISRTDDPSGAGNYDTDTRRITIVD